MASCNLPDGALRPRLQTPGCVMQAPVPRLNRAIAEEQLGVEAAARGDTDAAERLYAAAVEVRNAAQDGQRWEAREGGRAMIVHYWPAMAAHGCSPRAGLRGSREPGPARVCSLVQ